MRKHGGSGEAKAWTNERSDGTRLADIDTPIRDGLDSTGYLPVRETRDRFAERATELFLELVNP